MEIIKLTERTYDFILPSHKRAFERALWEVYVGDCQSRRSPYAIDNLCTFEAEELTDVFESNLMEWYIERNGGERTLSEYKQDRTPEVMVKFTSMFITDVVSFLLNNNLSFTIREYKQQEVRESWLKIPQTEVW